MTSDKVLIGKVVNAHGIRGDVKIKSFTTIPSDLCNYTPLLKADGTEIKVQLKSPAKSDVIIANIEGIKDRNEAEAIKGMEIYTLKSSITDDEDDITNVDTELGEILDSVVKEAKIERYSLFNAKITASSSSTYVGLKQDEYSNLIEKGAANESMMMPSNYSFCLLKVKDSKNVADIKQKVFDNCNTGKWICMSAEYVLAVDSGNYVALVMGYEDECKAIYDALKSKLGTVGETLERSVVE